MDVGPRYRNDFWGLIAAIALTVFVTVSLVGCGGGTSMNGLMDGAGGLFGGSPKIAVEPIVGAPKNIATQLTQALQTAGSERNLTILPSGAEGAEYTMRGYLLAAPERSRSTISYVWDVNDASGKRVTRVSGEETVAKGSSSNPWRGVNSTAIRNIANKTTSQLAANLPGGRRAKSPSVASTPAASSTGRTAASATTTAAATGAATASRSTTTPAKAAPKPSGVVVGSVTGAPGDGSRSLPAALRKRLPRSGVKVVSRGSNVYTVKGIVKLTSAGSGKEKIRIDWRVFDPAGKTLGTVSQQNTIPKGSLNGPWGAIADAAAGAAIPGIKKLVQ